MTTGEMLGPYRVLDKLGEGGMGEVYRARDTRLDRVVALKILPRALASDPQFRERFDREARVVSQLNHPHICVLHDVGRHNETDYLVLELIDGESLAERLARGPLPLDDALAIGIQICEALDKAHRHGVVHRDLKPGNVMLARPHGSRQAPVQAKLLDFGLAKTAIGTVDSNAAAAQAITAALTTQGTVLGTFQYMAPEQVEGAEADVRSDIWAFGCVVYEMVSGARPFTGRSPASLAGKILSAEPASLTVLKPDLPPAVDRIVRKCLAKDPDARWQSARDLGDELRWIREGRGATPTAAPARRWRSIERAAWGLALALAVGAASWLALRPQERRSPVRLSATVPIDAPLQSGANQVIAISPDGQRIVYGAMLGDRRQLFLRTIDQFEPTPIRGTDDGTSPAFSPDGEWVAFIADGKLKRVQLSGTSATTSLVEMATSRGLSWSDDGFIYLPLGIATGISRINFSGGAINAVTELDADVRSHRWPHVLPGGRTLLYVAQRHDTITFDQTDIVARRLDTHQEKILIRGGTDPRFVAPGHIVFGRGGVLMAIAFDERRLETVGEPVPVIESVVMHDLTGAGQYAVASNGTLVYAHGSAISTRALVWVDREGQETPAAPDERNFNTVRLSPEGRRVAYVDRSAGNADIWVFPLEGGSPYRLTFGRELEDAPVWSPDGIYLYYSSNKEGQTGIYRKRADGTGAEDKVYAPPQRNVVMHDISPDGRWLVLADGTRHLAVLSLTGEPAPRPLVTNTVSLAGSARISPDGKWLAYQALNETGGSGIYVRPFPDGEGHWQVTAGGRESRPVWSHDGREIYFRQGEQRLLAASVATTGSVFAVRGIRTLVQELRYAPSYDATRDGRLLMLKDQTNWTGTSLNVILNWARELRR